MIAITIETIAIAFPPFLRFRAIIAKISVNGTAMKLRKLANIKKFTRLMHRAATATPVPVFCKGTPAVLAGYPV